MAKSEKEIQKVLLAYAKAHPLIAWIDRANSGKVRVKGGFMQLHESGTPDLIGYSVSGKFVGIEIKDEKNFSLKGNGLRPDQVTRIADMKANGCYVGVACTIAHVDLIMESLGE